MEIDGGIARRRRKTGGVREMEADAGGQGDTARKALRDGEWRRKMEGGLETDLRRTETNGDGRRRTETDGDGRRRTETDGDGRWQTDGNRRRRTETDGDRFRQTEM